LCGVLFYYRGILALTQADYNALLNYFGLNKRNA
jgi:hypothetical protein